MKKNNSIWLLIIAFVTGSLISYILTKFHYLQIDYKVNITTSLISVITASIALYIAISLKKDQTKSTNLHNYLKPKLDFVWSLFLNLSHQLNLNDQIELTEVNKAIKEIYQNITPLKKMFTSFGLQNPCLSNLEKKVEEIEDILVDKSEISNNVISYSSQKEKLKNSLDEGHTLFVETLKVINTIS